ncbi:MAG: [ribosomal protein S18]-alanine N-acetyltransferase, partial [Pseudomonadota bacterium]|nr:[ribosomal protein S18]-alanine N-acetyltransferase [Pseudomonadota bacterium]
MSAVLANPVEMLPMNVHDLDEIVAIENTVYPYPWSRGNFSDSLVAGYSTWVCRVGGELVGYMVVMMAVDEAHLLNISVDKRHQGMGFGARLL